MGKTKNLKDKINENLRKVVRPGDEEEKIVEKPAEDWLPEFLAEFLAIYLGIDPLLSYNEVEKYYAIAKEIVERSAKDEDAKYSKIETPEKSAEENERRVIKDAIWKRIDAIRNKIEGFLRP